MAISRFYRLFAFALCASQLANGGTIPHDVAKPSDGRVNATSPYSSDNVHQAHPAVLPAEESLDWAPPPTDDFKHPAPSALPPTLPSNPPKDGHIFEKGGKEKKFPPKDDDDGEKSTSTNPPTSDAPAPTYARRDYTPVGTKRPPPLPSNPPKNPKDGKAPGFRPKQADDSSKAPSPAKDAPAPIHARRDDDYPVKPKDPIDNGYSPHE